MVSTEKGVASSAISLLSGRKELICNVHVSFAFGVTVNTMAVIDFGGGSAQKGHVDYYVEAAIPLWYPPYKRYTIGNEEKVQLRTSRQYSK